MKISRINPLYFYGGTQSNNRLKFEGQDIFTRNINEDKIMQNNEILNSVIDEFKRFEEVEAIGIGGSSAAKTADKASDIDVYIFTDKDIPIGERAEIVKKYSSNYEIGCEYFGAGDEFFVDKMGRQLDVMYFNKQWFENNFENVWLKHYPSNGYTTCFLHTLNVIEISYDKKGWLKGLKNRLQTLYPEKLKENIIKRNMMLLKDKPFASYYEQLEKAVKRNDLNSINHRSAAFLASYFDIIFAKNKILHPGEKRLVEFAKNNCKILPKDFEKDVNKLAAGAVSKKLETASRMVENLRKIL